MKKHALAALLPALCLALLVGCKSEMPADQAAPPVENASCGSIKTLHKTGDLYLASQPSAGDYAQLQAQGIKTVIDLRKDQEQRGFDEAKTVRDLGMTYVQIPWNGTDELDDVKFYDMRQALRGAERPILMKCGSSNRVGAGWLVYRVLDQGVPLDQAVEEAHTVGLRTAAYEAKALQYIKTHQK